MWVYAYHYSLYNFVESYLVVQTCMETASSVLFLLSTKTRHYSYMLFLFLFYHVSQLNIRTFHYQLLLDKHFHQIYQYNYEILIKVLDFMSKICMILYHISSSGEIYNDLFLAIADTNIQNAQIL